MMVISIRQHLSYIWNLIHEKVKQLWPRRHRTFWKSSERLMYVQFTSCVYWRGWFKKSFAYKKACTSSLAKFSVFPFLITMLFFEINTSVEILPWLSKKVHTKRFHCMIAALWNREHFQWICEMKHLVNKD